MVSTMRTTVGRAALLSPVQSSSGPRLPGVHIGVNRDTGEPWLEDPWVRKDSEESASTHTVVCTIAGIGAGKTTELVVEATQLAMRSRRIKDGADDEGLRVIAETLRKNDGVYEMAPLARWFNGATVTDLSEYRLTPFASDIGLDHPTLYRFITGLLEHRHVPFDDNMHTVLGAALSRMLDERMRSNASFATLGEILGSIKPEDGSGYLRQALGVSDSAVFDAHILEEDFRRAAAKLMQRLATVLSGPLGGIFGDKHSPGPLLSRNANILHYGGVPQEGWPFIQELFWAVMEQDEARGSAGGLHYSPDIDFKDESHGLIGVGRYAERLLRRIKMSRAVRTYIHIVMHTLRDYLTAGEAGSPRHNAAMAILNHVDQWRIGRQDVTELPVFREFFGLDNALLKQLPTLGVGERLVITQNEPPWFGRIVPTPEVRRLTKTNVANDVMMGRERHTESAEGRRRGIRA